MKEKIVSLLKENCAVYIDLMHKAEDSMLKQRIDQLTFLKAEFDYNEYKAKIYEISDMIKYIEKSL